METTDNATGLKQMFQSMCPDGSGIIEGKVTNISPLQVTLSNDDKMILNANTLIIPRHLTNYTTSVTITGGTTGGSMNKAGEPVHSHSITGLTKTGSTMMVNNSLQIGEMVLLLEFNNRKKYYILDRKGG